MDKLAIAKKYLYDNDLKLVVMKAGIPLATSKDRGIKPVYDVYTKEIHHLEGAYIADRVTGKAAAMILSEAGIKGIYTDLISEAAVEILEQYPILVEYKKRVPYILNREGDGMCPIEEISRGVVDVEGLIIGIEEFFVQVGMIK